MPRNPQGIYSLPAGNPVVSGTLIESTWANPTMSDIAAALTGSVPRDGSAGMQAQLLLVDQIANPPSGDQMAISVGYLNAAMENFQTGAQGGPGNPIIFENDRIATVDYTITNGKNGMTAGPLGVNPGVVIGIPAGSRWSIVGGGTTDGPPVALGDTAPLMDGTAEPGSGVFASRNDHVHPSDTTRAPISNPAFLGVPTAPTATLGTNTTQIATTAFVLANGGGALPSDATPAPSAGTGSAGVSTQFARGDHVHPLSAGYAPLDSPAFTGNPTAPTAAPGDNDTTIATTAFVANAVVSAGGLLPSNSLPLMNGTAAAGTGSAASRDDHVHPSDTSRAALASPTFTGVPAAPTAAVNTSTTQIATTAFVNAEIANDALLKASNLSDLPNAATARSNLGLSSRSQFDAACTDDNFAFLLQDQTFNGRQTFNAGVDEKYAAVAASAIDCSLASVFSRTISGVATFTFTNPATAGNVSSFILELTNGGSSTVNWPAGTKWASGTAPTLTAAGTDILGFYTHDGGVTWRGCMMSKDSK